MTQYHPAPLGAMALRAGSFMTGAGILTAAAVATIHATTEPGSPHANLVLALTAGVGVGALAIGAALRDKRRALAVAIGATLAAGELFGLVSTAERQIAAREAHEAPLREAKAARAAADKRLAEAEAAVKAAADRTLDAAAGKHCAKECRALLEGAQGKAAAELAAARTARAALPPAASGTALADRLGWPSWLLDLIVAALIGIGANGLAATLIAFSAHGPARQPITARAPVVDFKAPRITVAAEPHPDDSAQTDFPWPPLDQPPLPPATAPRPRERQEQVREFVTAYRAKHGRDPAPREVRAATGLPRSTAHRYQRRVATA